MATNNVKRPNKTNALEDVSVHGAGTAAKYLIRDIRNNFALLHHPNSWHLTDDGEWLPALSEVDIRPGLNRTSGIVGDEDIALFKEWLVKKNMTYINPADKRLGEWVGVVCHRKGLYAGNNGAYKPNQTHYYLGKGITTLITIPQNNGNILVEPKFDEERMKQFQRHLLQSGIIDPITEDVLHKELEILIRTRDVLSIRDKLSQSSQKHLDEIKNKIDIIEKQLAELGDEDEAYDVDNSTVLEDDSVEAIDFTPPTPPTKKGRK